MHGRDRVRACARCGAEMPAEQLVCSRCGEVQRQYRHVRCPTCGTINRRSRQVCLTCGERLPSLWVRPAVITAALAAGLLLVLIAAPLLRGGLDRIALLMAGSAGGATSQPVPTLGEASTATSLPKPSATPWPTESPTLLPSPTPAPTRTATRTPRPSPTPAPSDTATSAATLFATPVPSDTPTASPTPTASETPTATPSPTATPNPTATPLIHVVLAGDTLYGIALQYDTTVEAIMAANGLKDTFLKVGQKLIIPVATATPTATPTP
jgi:LysM repeat protein/DNA-directed RNA polymerase subunit RPC12/RpoP